MFQTTFPPLQAHPCVCIKRTAPFSYLATLRCGLFLASAVGAAANTVHACYAPAQDHVPRVELLAERGGHVERWLVTGKDAAQR